MMDNEIMDKAPVIKARELVDKLFKEVDFNECTSKNWGIATARLCAIICVDEIITDMKSKNPDYMLYTYWHPIDYWEQVRTEIEKML